MYKNLLRTALLLTLIAFAGGRVCAEGIRVGDAFAKGSKDGQSWTIGTGSIEASFEFVNGQLSRTSIANKTVDSTCVYESESAPFAVDVPHSGPFRFETLWSKSLSPGASADPASEQLTIPVKKDDLIGFGAVTRLDDRGALIEWPSTLDYGDGSPCLASTDDPTFPQ
ncbi:MAG: hypothetical protein K1Y02_20630, partial [Candidatus Hydrogenedentes bacterium]|nr:hypothetical protein [Candidatus Hydrogenedentota bacterium]